MSPEEGEIGVKITADDKASKPLKQVQKDLKGVSSSLSGLLGVLPGFNMLMALSGWIAKVKAAGGFKLYAKALIISTIETIKLGIATLVALWPIILIIAAVVAAIVIIMLIYQNWGKIVEWFQKVKEKFFGWFRGAWTAITKFLAGIWTWIKKNWKLLLTILLIVATGGLGLIFLAWKNNWGGLQDFTKKMYDWLLKLWGALIAASKGDWSQLANIIKGIVTTIVKFVTNIFVYMVKFVIGQIKKIPIIGGAIAGGLSYLGNLLNVTGFAFGTRYVMHDTLAMVHKGERIIPSHSATTYNTSSYTPAVSVTINATVGTDIDIDNMGRRVAEIIERELGRTML